jgi:hypothetical protein
MSSVPQEWVKDFELLPPILQKLLLDELAAGNTIIDVGHSHPAAPVGVYFKLAGPVTTTSRLRQRDDGLDFYERNSSLYSGQFTDAKGFCYILEAPLPPPAYPDMDAIREAANKPAAKSPLPTGNSPHDRFVRSMEIDYEKWHDGIGYDLEAIADASTQERIQIEELMKRQTLGWREVEALVALDSPTARAYLKKAMRGMGTDAEARAAILRMAPELVSTDARVESIVDALDSSVIYGGLSQTLDLVEDFHPPEVIDALLKGVVRREGDVACHFAAMLFFLHGKAKEAFDWDHRPYYLEFNTEDQDKRWEMFVDLCGKIGVDPARYRVGRRKT